MAESWKEGERQIAKALERFWGVKFYRSEGSGAVATSRQKTLPKTVVDALTGDVICDPFDPKLNSEIGWPFSVEVKTKHTPIDVFSICRNGKKSEISDWWEQCCKDAIRVDRLPLLFMKMVKGRGWFVAVDLRFLRFVLTELEPKPLDSETSVQILNSIFVFQIYVAEASFIHAAVMSVDLFYGLGRERIEKAVIRMKRADKNLNFIHPHSFF